MTNDIFMRLARQTVLESYKRNDDLFEYEAELTIDDVYIVWFCKTLQNWKALAATANADGKYYEVTYNGDANEIYLDTYTKVRNEVYKPDYPSGVTKV